MRRVLGRGPQADVAQFHTDENPEPATLPFGRHGTDLQTDWRRLKPSGSPRQHGPGMGGDVPPLWRASHRSPATAKTGPPRAGTPGGGPRSRRRKPRAPGPRPRISTHIPHRVRPRPRPVARVPRRGVRPWPQIADAREIPLSVSTRPATTFCSTEDGWDFLKSAPTLVRLAQVWLSDPPLNSAPARGTHCDV